MKRPTMNRPRPYRPFAVAAIGLLLAGLLPVCVLAAPNPHPAAIGTASPVVLYTDITSGPITGGENNKGIYLSVFGKNFGSSSGMGVSTKVYIGGVEVDNYRYLGASRVAGASGIQQITVQVGGLGSPTLGTGLPIDVRVDGVDSNTDVTFIPNPGKIYFVSTSGTDTTGVANDITHPYRHVQLPGIGNNGNAGCPISGGDEPVSTAGVWGLVHPGDFIVMRGGTWTDLGRDDFFMRFQNKSGTAPTGAVGSGPISVIGYPTETAFINMDHNANSSVNGGISSADSARQALGCGSWVTLADLRLESGGREGMITTQAGYSNPVGSHWRVVNNELTAVSVDPSSPAKGAGVAGSGVGEQYYGNYIHDVHGGTPEHENHGFYVDGSGSYDIAYNWIKNIVGNGINVYGSSGTDPNNIQFHHNVIDGVGKHGLNIADGATHDLNFYDNLVYNIANYCVRFNTDSLIGNGVKVWNNTFYGCGTVRDDFGYHAVVANTWNDLSPSRSSMYNNIFVSSTTGPSYFGGADVGAVDSNLYFGTSDTTSYSTDAHAVVANPLFTSTTPGSENFALQAGSPAVNAGTASVASLLLSTRDLSLDVIRPHGGSYDIGAYELSGSVTPPEGATYQAVTPARVLESRPIAGHIGADTFQSRVKQTVQITGGASGVPADAVAVTGNVTVTNQSGKGYVTVAPSLTSGVQPPTSTINFPTGDNRANGVTVPLHSGGTLDFMYWAGTGARVDIIFDVTGFFAIDPTGATYHTVPPTRVLETRNIAGHVGANKFSARVVQRVQIATVASGVPADAVAITGNVTVTNQTAHGYVTVAPSLTTGIQPATSTINFPTNDNRANGVTVPLLTGGSLDFMYWAAASSTVDILFDVTGFFRNDTTGAKYYTVTPARVLESRPIAGHVGASTFGARIKQTVQVATLASNVPTAASAVTGNVTVTNQSKLGYVTVAPSLTTGLQPPTSTINFPTKDNRANGVTVPLNTGGTLDFMYWAAAGASIDIIFDVTGYFLS